MSSNVLWESLVAKLKNILELKATLEALDFSVDLEVDRLAEDTFYIRLDIYAPPMDIDSLAAGARQAGHKLIVDELAAQQPRTPDDYSDIPF